MNKTKDFGYCFLVIGISFIALRQETGDRLIAHVDGHRTSLVHLLASGLFGIEMVLAGLAGGDFAIFTDLESFAVGFIGFHIFRGLANLGKLSPKSASQGILII
jgi:hypothetical protein